MSLDTLVCLKRSSLILFRLDSDQCARRTARNYLHLKDLDYYEYEGHIFFDDATEEDDNNEQVPNKFVQQLLGVVDRAATYVYFHLQYLL